MTSGRRALAGAAFGALLTLIIHPVSRPYLLALTHRTPPAAIETCLDKSDTQPEAPHDLYGASQWVCLALERVSARNAPLRPGEVETVLGIIDVAARNDPDNAFWKQSKAAILLAVGRPMEAKALWIRASRAQFWNDYQSVRLGMVRDRIANTTGSRQAWQLAYVYEHRSFSAASTIERFARTLLGGADPNTREGLAIRYATLRNGNLMREGAKSVPVGRMGADIVDLTTYPANLAKDPSPRSLWTGQTEMLDRMTHLGPDWSEKSDSARKTFANNEAWRALIGYEDPIKLPEKYALLSIASSGITGAMAIVACLGAALHGAGLLVQRTLGNRSKIAWPMVIAVAMALGVAGGFLMNDFFAGVATMGCSLLLGISPPKLRKSRPLELGPLFAVYVSTIAIAFSLTVVGFMMGQTTSAEMLLPLLGVPSEYYRTPMLLGLAAIPLGFLLLAVPMWSSAQRLPVPHVLAIALRKFGAFLAVGGLAATILLTPISVFADRKLGESLEQLVGNEPLFYYIRPWPINTFSPPSF